MTMNNTNEVKLEHAFVTVRDLDRTLAFYRKLFPEWTVRWQGKSRRDSRWLHFGPAGDGQPSYLSLCENREAGEMAPAYETVRVQHLGFAHPDVKGLIATLASAGVEPQDELMDDGRFRRIYFSDPDGHELEFVEKITR